MFEGTQFFCIATKESIALAAWWAVCEKYNGGLLLRSLMNIGVF